MSNRFKVLSRDIVRQMTAHLPRRPQSEYTRAIFSNTVQAMRVGLDLVPFAEIQALREGDTRKR